MSDSKTISAGHHLRSLFCAVILTFIYFCVLISFCGITIQYDSIAMKLILSGELSGSPSAHVLFINYAIAKLITFFYLRLPGLQWYYAFLLGTNFLAVAAILYRGIDLMLFRAAERRAMLFVVFFSVMLLCLFPLLVLLQHTFSAALCAAAFLFFYFSTDEHSRIESAVSALLCLLTIALRTAVFYMSFPSILLLSMLRYIRSRNVKREAALIVFLLAAVIINAGVNRMAYTGIYESEDELNELRAQLQDYGSVPDYIENEDLYAALKIDYTDAELLRREFWGLSPFFNTENMSSLVAADHSKNISIHEHLSIVKNALMSANIKTDLFFKLTVSIFICTSILFALLCRQRTCALFMMLLTLASSAELLYLAWIDRMLIRAYYPIFCCLCSAILAISSSIKANHSLLSMRLAAGFAAAAVCISAVTGTVRAYNNNHKDYISNGSYYELEKYLLSQSDKTFMYVNGYWTEPLDLIPDHTANYCRLSNWLGETPEWKSFVSGEYDSVWDGIIYRDDLFLVAYSSSDTIDFLCDYLCAHGHSVSAEKETVSFGGRSFVIAGIYPAE